jgi:hypothetical protein
MLPDCDPRSPEARRWRRRFLIFSFSAAVMVMGAALLAKLFPLRSPARIALALFEGAVTAAIIVGSVRSIRRLDEMQLRIHLDAMAFAFAGTGVLATTYGFLVTAGLPDIDWGGILWPAMVALWVIGILIASRRYR